MLHPKMIPPKNGEISFMETGNTSFLPVGQPLNLGCDNTLKPLESDIEVTNFGEHQHPTHLKLNPT